MTPSSNDFLFTLKPSGYNTHSPDIGKKGFVEVLSAQLHQELFVVHRLDKETSGALLFATSKKAAAELAALFEKHLVQKKYVFLTDRRVDTSAFEYESAIEKEKHTFVNHPDRPANSKTHFKKLKSFPIGDLWQAEPITGKPHQIRLHAEANGIPVLGDKDHNGSAFYRLCLHSSALSFEYQGRKHHFEAEAPVWISELELNPQTTDQEDLMILEAFQKRQWLLDFQSKPTECFRLSHQDIDTYRIDMFGDHLWVYWYRDADPSERDLARFERIATKFQKKFYVRKMLNRGEDPNAQVLWPAATDSPRWIATENGVRFECRSDTGLSPGLFLDQRENRRWVRENSRDKCVLNLFSYTGGFSVNAALGGAKEVATVDVSANFLDWCKVNFEINGFTVPKAGEDLPEKPRLSYKSLMSDEPVIPRYEFWCQDSLLFLKGTAKRKRKFDLIICDPPSFGRSKNGVFSISKNYEELLMNCFYCLGKGGLLLFCTNYEKWTPADLTKNVQRLKAQFNFTILPPPGTCLDFELPDEDPLMKSIVLRKN